MAGITLNGTTFYPSDVPKTIEKIGVSLVAANGSRTWVQRTTAAGAAIHKRVWVIPWRGVSNTVRAAVQTIFLLTAPFTFVDHLGTSYTVQCEADGYDETVSLVQTDSINYYDITLTIYEV